MFHSSAQEVFLEKRSLAQIDAARNMTQSHSHTEDKWALQLDNIIQIGSVELIVVFYWQLKY